ncbi:3033_t:CDS:2 [Entrophospora sp. SA101]|nr:3033_t:CDS:2 [Entrophospora sp. SA101]
MQDLDNITNTIEDVDNLIDQTNNEPQVEEVKDYVGEKEGLERKVERKVGKKIEKSENDNDDR